MKKFLVSILTLLVMLLIMFCFGAFAMAELIPATTDPQNPFLLYLSVVMSCLFAISEALSVVPAIKANGVFQLLVNIIKAFLGKT